jgi:hypothetical protein
VPTSVTVIDPLDITMFTKNMTIDKGIKQVLQNAIDLKQK